MLPTMANPSKAPPAPSSPLNKPDTSTADAKTSSGVDVGISPASPATIADVAHNTGGTTAVQTFDELGHARPLDVPLSSPADLDAEKFEAVTGRDPRFAQIGSPTGFDRSPGAPLVDEMAAAGVAPSIASPTQGLNGPETIQAAPGVRHIAGTEIVHGGPTQQ